MDLTGSDPKREDAVHYLFIAVAVLLRWLPHPWSVTPIGGIGLFAGAWCPPRFAWVFPLIPLAIGDAITGFYDWRILVFVALIFGGHWLATRYLKRRHVKA